MRHTKRGNHRRGLSGRWRKRIAQFSRWYAGFVLIYGVIGVLIAAYD